MTAVSEERTEEASPKKLREARARGDVWRSKEAQGAAVLLAAGMAAGVAGPALVAAYEDITHLVIDAVAGRLPVGPGAVLEAAIGHAAVALAPFLLAPLAAGTLAAWVQVGPLVSMDAIAWKPERLDPLAGLAQLVSRKRALEVAKALLVLAVLFAVAIVTLRDGLRSVLALTGASVGTLAVAVGALVRTLLLRVGGALLAVGVLDVVVQRWQWLRAQRMTPAERKREHKESEGDPHTRHARDRLRHEIAQHGALEQARRADVLVVNPTHLAVALRFDEEGSQGAPEVLAKGQDELAQRMIQAAREAGVPVLRDVPLAHGLFALEEGQEIPEALYEAVAIVLRAAWAERDGDPR